MSDRDELRSAGASLRRELGIPSSGDEVAAGFQALVDEAGFGRIWSRPGLAREDRMLATLAALTSRQHLPQITTYTRAALTLGLNPRAIQEVMIHCGIYTGFAAAENSLAAVATVFEEEGVHVPALDEADLDLGALMDAGVDTMHTLHAERSQGSYASPKAGAPAELYPTAVQYGYGAIWHRPGLDLRQRMICTVASFTSLEAQSQMHKFFRSALNVGLSRTEVIEAIMQTSPYTGFPRALNALVIAEEVLADT